MKRLAGIMALLILISGCASGKSVKVDSTKYVISDSVRSLHISYDLNRRDGGVKVKLSQSFVADVKVVDQYARKTTATQGMISDMPLFGIAISPMLILSDMLGGNEKRYTIRDQKVHTDRGKSISSPVEDGSMVTGHIVMKEVVGEHLILSRVVTYETQDSAFLLPVPHRYDGCVIVNFDGILNTHNQQVPINIHDQTVC